MSTDHDTIRGWVEQDDMTPVRYSGVEGETNQLRIVPERDVGESHETLTWDDFGRELDESERVVVYHGAGDFEVIDRTEAETRATVENEGFEEALLEGETVTSEVTETKVVERTVVEEATIENEVVDRYLVDEEIVSAELLHRDVTEFGLLVDEPETVDVADIDRYDAGFPADEEARVEVLLDEEWRLTKERTEELVVESRIVDTDTAETDTVASDDVDITVDTERVQRSVLESGLFESDVGANEIIERGDVRSEFQEGAVVRTQLPVKTMVEEDVAIEKQLFGTLTEGETLGSSTIREEEFSSEIVSDHDFESDLLVARQAREEGESGSPAGDPSEGMTESAGSVEGMIGSETGTADQTPDDAVQATPERGLSEADEGKQVVNQDGENVGHVTDVRGDTLYVEPDHSLTEKIADSLGWNDDEDDDVYPVETQSVTSVTDDHVYISTSSSSSRAT